MLAQLGDDLFLTDGGMETWLIFDAGFELPQFAAFTLLDDPQGVEALRRYFESYVELARANGVGLVLDAPTWRASSHWGELIGYGAEQLADVNRRAVALLDDVRRDAGGVKIVIGGCVGPSDDAYAPGEQVSADEAYTYHRPQIETFAQTPADLVNALTLTYPAEAVGIARAANDVGLPVAISFTVETDGRLPGGESLADAVEQVDGEADVAYFMVNCAHPTHFADVLAEGGAWRERLWGVRANASRKSHAELDEAEELDAGDPQELAGHYPQLRERLPNLRVAGGCCGTDDRHIAAICAALS
ncbi:MAG TPA: homocysteine S-methyltransferase family protein [Gaiellaceae bacterium]|jgi:S-methylmethionine-dependent homocysteine/selenocysteine methylase|nr:homocysteine S-methyltransferase family protein [Gaiellaceae bacterium]